MRRVCRLLESRWLPLVLALVAVLLCAPALWVGLAVDDLFQQARLRGHDPFAVHTQSSGALASSNDRPAIDMFWFFDGDPVRGRQLIDRGAAPWWTLPSLKASFFRPLSALTHLLDEAAWPGQVALKHLHSLLWFAGLVAVVTLLYRRILGPTWVAGLAALLYTVDDAHGFAVGWLANRNALIATLLGVLAILAHRRWAKTGQLRHLAGAMTCLLAGLLAGEAAVAAGAYIAAHSLTLEQGSWQHRILRLCPYLGLGLAWWIVHHWLGYGTRGSGLYIDPSHEPLQLIAAAVERIPVALTAQLALPSASTFSFVTDPSLRLLWWGWALAVVIAMATLLWPILRADATARFWAIGMVLATVPISATFPHDRLLFFVGLGGMGLLAQLVSHLLHYGGRLRKRLVIGGVVLLHLVVAGLSLPVSAYSPAVLARIMEEDARAVADGEATDLTNQDLVLVNPPVPFLAGYLPLIRRTLDLPAPKQLRILGPGTTPIVLERIDSRTLVVRPQDGFISAPMDELFRGRSYPMATGQQLDLPGCTIEISEVLANGRPAEVRFRFDTPLEHRSLRWIAWQNGEPQPFVPPAIGEQLVLPAQEALPMRRLLGKRD